jgi:hypothetical protein
MPVEQHWLFCLIALLWKPLSSDKEGAGEGEAAGVGGELL